MARDNVSPWDPVFTEPPSSVVVDSDNKGSKFRCKSSYSSPQRTGWYNRGGDCTDSKWNNRTAGSYGGKKRLYLNTKPSRKSWRGYGWHRSNTGSAEATERTSALAEVVKDVHDSDMECSEKEPGELDEPCSKIIRSLGHRRNSKAANDRYLLSSPRGWQFDDGQRNNSLLLRKGQSNERRSMYDNAVLKYWNTNEHCQDSRYVLGTGARRYTTGQGQNYLPSHHMGDYSTAHIFGTKGEFQHASSVVTQGGCISTNVHAEVAMGIDYKSTSLYEEDTSSAQQMGQQYRSLSKQYYESERYSYHDRLTASIQYNSYSKENQVPHFQRQVDQNTKHKLYEHHPKTINHPLRHMETHQQINQFPLSSFNFNNEDVERKQRQDLSSNFKEENRGQKRSFSVDPDGIGACHELANRRLLNGKEYFGFCEVWQQQREAWEQWYKQNHEPIHKIQPDSSPPEIQNHAYTNISNFSYNLYNIASASLLEHTQNSSFVNSNYLGQGEKEGSSTTRSALSNKIVGAAVAAASRYGCSQGEIYKREIRHNWRHYGRQNLQKNANQKEYQQQQHQGRQCGYPYKHHRQQRSTSEHEHFSPHRIVDFIDKNNSRYSECTANPPDSGFYTDGTQLDCLAHEREKGKSSPYSRNPCLEDKSLMPNLRNVNGYFPYETNFDDKTDRCRHIYEKGISYRRPDGHEMVVNNVIPGIDPYAKNFCAGDHSVGEVRTVEKTCNEIHTENESHVSDAARCTTTSAFADINDSFNRNLFTYMTNPKYSDYVAYGKEGSQGLSEGYKPFFIGSLKIEGGTFPSFVSNTDQDPGGTNIDKSNKTEMEGSAAVTEGQWGMSTKGASEYDYGRFDKDMICMEEEVNGSEDMSISDNEGECIQADNNVALCLEDLALSVPQFPEDSTHTRDCDHDVLVGSHGKESTGEQVKSKESTEILLPAERDADDAENNIDSALGVKEVNDTPSAVPLDACVMDNTSRVDSCKAAASCVSAPEATIEDVKCDREEGSDKFNDVAPDPLDHLKLKTIGNIKLSCSPAICVLELPISDADPSFENTLLLAQIPEANPVNETLHEFENREAYITPTFQSIGSDDTEPSGEQAKPNESTGILRPFERSVNAVDKPIVSTLGVKEVNDTLVPVPLNACVMDNVSEVDSCKATASCVNDGETTIKDVTYDREEGVDKINVAPGPLEYSKLQTTDRIKPLSSFAICVLEPTISDSDPSFENTLLLSQLPEAKSAGETVQLFENRGEAYIRAFQASGSCIYKGRLKEGEAEISKMSVGNRTPSFEPDEVSHVVTKATGIPTELDLDIVPVTRRLFVHGENGEDEIADVNCGKDLREMETALSDVNSAFGDVNNLVGEVNNAVDDVKNAVVDVNNAVGDVNNAFDDVNNTVGEIVAEKLSMDEREDPGNPQEKATSYIDAGLVVENGSQNAKTTSYLPQKKAVSQAGVDKVENKSKASAPRRSSRRRPQTSFSAYVKQTSAWGMHAETLNRKPGVSQSSPSKRKKHPVNHPVASECGGKNHSVSVVTGEKLRDPSVVFCSIFQTDRVENISVNERRKRRSSCRTYVSCRNVRNINEPEPPRMGTKKARRCSYMGSVKDTLMRSTSSAAVVNTDAYNCSPSLTATISGVSSSQMISSCVGGGVDCGVLCTSLLNRRAMGCSLTVSRMPGEGSGCMLPMSAGSIVNEGLDQSKTSRINSKLCGNLRNRFEGLKPTGNSLTRDSDGCIMHSNGQITGAVGDATNTTSQINSQRRRRECYSVQEDATASALGNECKDNRGVREEWWEDVGWVKVLPDRLGQGTFGSVFKAEWRREQQPLSCVSIDEKIPIYSADNENDCISFNNQDCSLSTQQSSNNGVGIHNENTVCVPTLKNKFGRFTRRGKESPPKQQRRLRNGRFAPRSEAGQDENQLFKEGAEISSAIITDSEGNIERGLNKNATEVCLKGAISVCMSNKASCACISAEFMPLALKEFKVQSSAPFQFLREEAMMRHFNAHVIRPIATRSYRSCSRLTTLGSNGRNHMPLGSIGRGNIHLGSGGRGVCGEQRQPPSRVFQLLMPRAQGDLLCLLKKTLIRRAKVKLIIEWDKHVTALKQRQEQIEQQQQEHVNMESGVEGSNTASGDHDCDADGACDELSAAEMWECYRAVGPCALTEFEAKFIFAQLASGGAFLHFCCEVIMRIAPNTNNFHV